MNVTFLTDRLEPPTYDKVYRRHRVGRVGLALDPETQAIVGFELVAYCDHREVRKEIPVGQEVEPAGARDCELCAETVEAIAKANIAGGS